MSNPPNGFNTDPSFNKFKGTYYNNDIDVSGGHIISRTGNLYLAPNSSIFTSDNQIQFNEEFQFTDFVNNVNVLGQLKNTYNSISYDVGLQCEKVDDLVSDVGTISPIVYDTAYKCTNFYYDAGQNSTIFSNNVSFPSNSIASTSINNNNRFVDLASNNVFTGTNQFSQSVRLDNNLRLQGALITDNGTTNITNATLSKINFLANVTSDINSSISALNTKTTNISFFGTTTTFGGLLSFPLNSINSTAIINNNFVALTGNQSVGGIKTYNSQAIFSNNIRLDTGSLILNSNTLTLTNANLQKIQFLSTVSSDIQTQINNINAVTLAANNVFTGSNSFNGNLNVTTFNSTVQINNGFGALYNNAVQFVFYPTQTTFSNGSSGENVFEFTANNTDRGITFQGGKGSDGRSLFGLYYLSGSFAVPSFRTPIMYGRDTGTQSTNVLTIASGTLATTNITFSGTLNTISTTIFGYLSGLTENIKTSLDSLSSRASTLETKNTGISYSGTTTTIGNTLATSTLTFSGTLNTISTTVFGYLSGLTESIKTSLDNLSARIGTFEIVGTIIMSPLSDLQTTTSNKYLMCNGQAVSRTTYSALFAKFGELFSAGDGSTTFGLPNYNGMFLRGMGNQTINGVNYGNYNSTYSPDQDSVQDHTHAGQAGSYLGSLNSTQTIGYRPQSSSAPNSYTFATTGAMNSGRINAIETKPVSIGIYYYVRT